MDTYLNVTVPNSCHHSSATGNGGQGTKAENCGAGKRGKTMKLSTDPQSVAARRRRHRISERFKTLQSLIPGGGERMDTASMLEEVIQYVKFLKAQIRLHQVMIPMAAGEGSSPFPVGPPHFLSHDYQQIDLFCSEHGVGLEGSAEVQDSPELGFPENLSIN